MALFSRRKKNSDDPDDAGKGRADGESAAVSPDGESAPPPTPVEDVPQVSISVSTYRGAGAPAASRPAAPGAAHAPGGRRIVGNGEPPAQTETVAGLRDNALLREALGKVSERSNAAELVEVTRQLLQGHLFLRVRGDARALLAEGKGLPLAVGRSGDQQYVLAFSSGAALQAAVQADGDVETSAVGQPVMQVLKHVLDGNYAGLLLDGASGTARAILPRAVLEQAVRQADPTLRIKAILTASPRPADAPARLAAALVEAPLWVAVNKATASDGTEKVGIAEARTADGLRLLNIFSHPLEIVAMERSDRALPFTAAQLGKALRGDEALGGVIVDAGGPWISLTRDELAPVMALPDPPVTPPAAPASGGAAAESTDASGEQRPTAE